MNEATQNWEDCLGVGLGGEKLLLELFPTLMLNPSRKNDPTAPDLINSRGQPIEVKSERNTDTGYMFMETDSRREKEKLGGPWQAMEKGATIFVHLFLNPSGTKILEIRCWKTATLVDRLNKDRDKYKERTTNKLNRGGTTYGLLVPKNDLLDIELNIYEIL